MVLLRGHKNKIFGIFLFTSSKPWGLIVYEQDWLHNEFEAMGVLYQNLTLADTWLLEMGLAAERAGLTVQYCMPWARHLLASSQIPTVTQIRASGDYQPGRDQWRIGDSSIVIFSLGLAPFKDNFWSTTVQPGNKYGKTEPYPELHAVVSALSAGPIAPGDKIGYSNSKLIMKTCTADGLLLKPDKPATSIDETFFRLAFNNSGPFGQVWSTYTNIDGYEFNYVFAAELTSIYQLFPESIERNRVVPNPKQRKILGNYAYQYNATNTTYQFDNNNPIAFKKCGRHDFQLWYIAPQLFNGWILLGETTKFIPISKQRIISISATSEPNQITVKIRGVPKEQVTLQFSNGSTVHSFTCAIADAGYIKVTAPEGNCSL